MDHGERQFDHIYLASDHAGFAHKEAVATWLAGESVPVTDLGAAHFDEGDDFPPFMFSAAHTVVTSPQRTCAIIFGGSGQGEAMAANRVVGIRAAVFYGGDESIVRLSRQHNDANILSIGARFVSIDDTKRLIWEWLHTMPFEDEKYTRRNQMLDRDHHA